MMGKVSGQEPLFFGFRLEIMCPPITYSGALTRRSTSVLSGMLSRQITAPMDGHR